jgi:hypothetical protein
MLGTYIYDHMGYKIDLPSCPVCKGLIKNVLYCLKITQKYE